MSGNLRIRNGLAYGRENNFYTGIAGQKGYLAGTDGLFAQANTSPDVTLGTIFYTNNSAATIITGLTLSHPSQGAGNIAGLHEGREFRLFFLDSNTTLAGSQFKLIGTDNLFAQNSFLELFYHNSAFYETSRSNNYSSLVPVTLANSNGLNANFVSSFMMTYVSTGGVTGTAVIQSVSGGMIGQRLLLINNQSSGIIAISTGGNISYSFTAATYFPGSGGGLQVLLAASGGTAELVKVSNGQWSLIGR